MGFSNAKAVEILNQVFRTDEVYLALYTSNPTPANTGQEVNGGGYARQQIEFSVPVAEGGKQTIKNNGAISFPVAAGDWGTVTHVGFLTEEIGGTFLAFGALNSPRTILTGDRFVIDLNSGIVRLS